MSFFETLINFFKSIFGGNKSASTDATEQTVEQSTASTTTTTENKLTRSATCPIPEGDPNYVTGTRMKVATYDYGVYDEPTQDAKDYVAEQMRIGDVINEYPYTILTAKNKYTVKLRLDSAGIDHTAEYGTGIDTEMRHG